MREYQVWMDGWNDRGSAHTVFASHAEDAVKEFATSNWSRWDYITECSISMVDPEGHVSEWVVTVEMIPEFSAKRVSLT